MEKWCGVPTDIRASTVADARASPEGCRVGEVVRASAAASAPAREDNSPAEIPALAFATSADREPSRLLDPSQPSTGQESLRRLSEAPPLLAPDAEVSFEDAPPLHVSVPEAETSIDALRSRALARFSEGINTGELEHAVAQALARPQCCDGSTDGSADGDGGSTSGCCHVARVGDLMAEVANLREENKALLKENQRLRDNQSPTPVDAASVLAVGSAVAAVRTLQRDP